MSPWPDDIQMMIDSTRELITCDGIGKERKEKLVEQWARLTLAWREESSRQGRGLDYYRNELVKIGEMIGPESRVADDGSVSEGVICAKVAELVEVRLGRRAVREVRDH
jgi:hypothetical protein